jgi:hypothetical protein
MTMLSEKEDCTLSRTVASMLKVLLTRELAIQFSMTGLGKKRRREKLVFKGSSACRLIEREYNKNYECS